MLPPSPAEIDARARRISAHAAAVRVTAARLERDLHSASWRGAAATAFGASAADTAGALRAAADRLDTAAAALHHHARAVELTCHHLQLLALRTGRGIGDLVTTLAGDAGSFTADVAHLVGI